MNGSPPFAPVEIREARSEDCARLAAIYNQAIRSGRSTMDTRPVEASLFREWIADAPERELLLSGRVQGEVVAWGSLKRYSERDGYATTAETSVYVADGATGHGYGSALLEALLEHAHRLGYHHLVAKIMAVNTDSVRFHQRHGYEKVGVQRRVGFLNDHWHDVVILQRLLQDD